MFANQAIYTGKTYLAKGQALPQMSDDRLRSLVEQGCVSHDEQGQKLVTVKDLEPKAEAKPEKKAKPAPVAE